MSNPATGTWSGRFATTTRVAAREQGRPTDPTGLMRRCHTSAFLPTEPGLHHGPRGRPGSPIAVGGPRDGSRATCSTVLAAAVCVARADKPRYRGQPLLAKRRARDWRSLNRGCLALLRRTHESEAPVVSTIRTVNFDPQQGFLARPLRFLRA